MFSGGFLYRTVDSTLALSLVKTEAAMYISSGFFVEPTVAHPVIRTEILANRTIRLSMSSAPENISTMGVFAGIQIPVVDLGKIRAAVGEDTFCNE